METYIVTRETTDITTDNGALAKAGDPWPERRPLVVTHNHYGDGMDLSITKRYPDGVIPVEALATGAMFRVTVERIEAQQ